MLANGISASAATEYLTHDYHFTSLCVNLMVENKGAYLRMRTQMATKEYAKRVPMDMRSTRAARSNRKAIRAGRRSKTRS